MNVRLIAPALALALVAGAASAHHGWGSYDAAKKITITSTVGELQWQNPHVHVRVTHEGRSWEAVLAPPFRMEARALKPEMLKPGTQVAIEGYPSTRTPTEMRAERISVAGSSYELR